MTHRGSWYRNPQRSGAHRRPDNVPPCLWLWLVLYPCSMGLILRGRNEPRPRWPSSLPPPPRFLPKMLLALAIAAGAGVSAVWPLLQPGHHTFWGLYRYSAGATVLMCTTGLIGAAGVRVWFKMRRRYKHYLTSEPDADGNVPEVEDSRWSIFAKSRIVIGISLAVVILYIVCTIYIFGVMEARTTALDISEVGVSGAISIALGVLVAQ